MPESVAFAFMAHIKPPIALHAAWIVGLICTVFGGRSGMVNGAEGAFAIDEIVAVLEGPFKGMSGPVLEYDEAEDSLTLALSVMGRDTRGLITGRKLVSLPQHVSQLQIS